jgi:hypothetical protein
MATPQTMATAKRVVGVDGGNNGNRVQEGARDMAACATTGERGLMVAMGHGFCVCFCVSGETTKNKEESKIVNVT